MVRMILNGLLLIDLVLTCGEKGLGQEFPAFSCIIERFSYDLEKRFR